MNEMNINVPWEGWTSVGKLGAGGYGTVYKIVRKTNSSGEDCCAMKIITIPNSEDEIDELGYQPEMIRTKLKENYEDVLKEYQIMREMQGHSNIVSCMDIYEEELTDRIGWRIYIRMEYLTPLKQYLKNHEMREEDIVRLGKDICRALVLCEDKKIVHRDVKPENILYSTGIDSYKLGDFGIARTMGHLTTATMVGTPNYEAPEVYNNKKYDKRVDIYSLGLVLYWLLNGRRLPFWPDDRPPSGLEMEEALRRRNVKGESIPAPTYGSSELKAVVMKACSFYKKYRYSSAREMLNDLEIISAKANPIYSKGKGGLKDNLDDISITETVNSFKNKKSNIAGAKSTAISTELEDNLDDVSTTVTINPSKNKKLNITGVKSSALTADLKKIQSITSGGVKGKAGESVKETGKTVWNGPPPLSYLFPRVLLLEVLYVGVNYIYNVIFKGAEVVNSRDALVNYTVSNFNVASFVLFYAGPLLMLFFSCIKSDKGYGFGSACLVVIINHIICCLRFHVAFIGFLVLKSPNAGENPYIDALVGILICISVFIVPLLSIKSLALVIGWMAYNKNT